MAFLPQVPLPSRTSRSRSPSVSIPSRVDERTAVVANRRRRVYGVLSGPPTQQAITVVPLETVCSASKRDEMRRSLLQQIQQRNEQLSKSNAKREMAFKQELMSLRAAKQAADEQQTPDRSAPVPPTSAHSASTQPVSAQYASAQASSAQPASAQPSSAEPSSAEPSSAEPSTSEPSSAEPVPKQPAPEIFASSSSKLDPSHELPPVPERELLSATKQHELLKQAQKYEQIAPAPKYEELVAAPESIESDDESETRQETESFVTNSPARGVEELYSPPPSETKKESQEEPPLEKAFQTISRTVETVVDDARDSIGGVMENLTESRVGTTTKEKEEEEEEDVTQPKTEAQKKPFGSKVPSIGKAILDAIVEGVPSKPKAMEETSAADKSDLVFLVESGKIKNLTVSKLRRLLSANNLKTSGRKAELIARLTSFAKQ